MPPIDPEEPRGGAAQVVPPTDLLGTTDETFEFTLADGSVVVVGRPRVVLKMRLRNMLGSFVNDAELQGIARAFLSIRTIQAPGQQPAAFLAPGNQLLFEAFMNRFGSDEVLDTFINKYMRLVNREAFDKTAALLREGMEKGLKGADLQEFVESQAAEYALKTLDELRD